jgi:hypothetical protein
MSMCWEIPASGGANVSLFGKSRKVLVAESKTQPLLSMMG